MKHFVIKPTLLRGLLLVFTITISLGDAHVFAQINAGPGGPGRIFLDSALAPFYHGVASGDPLPSAVVLWTRLTIPNPASDSVYWEVATDTLFTNRVQSGVAPALESRDYTVKVDVRNLQPGTWYYYRFRHQNRFSIMGRTRTAPAPGNQTPARFAVASCSNYQDGFFNAYRDMVNSNEVDAVIHLGDYLYEYGINDFSPGVDSSRLHQPPIEVLSLGEYRARHSHYKLDPDLRDVHRQYPFIAVWDDHETANDAWTGGAQNHTEATEGPWENRKNAGRQAYYDWMPVRDLASGQTDTIRRQFQWGGLISLIMLDTRLEGRERQIGTSGAAVNDTNRTLLGPPQLAWFQSNLQNTNARWKLIGNQVMISPLRIFGSAVNQDQWDGYPVERSKILRFLQNNSINNVVFLTGDIHTSWANDVPLNIATYNGTTGQGSVASEFVCTSVTSTSFLTFPVPLALIRSFNPNVKYADLTRRGYITLNVALNETQADWVHMSTVENRNFTRSISSSWRTQHLANRLTQANAPIPPRTGMPPLAPAFVSPVLGTQKSVSQSAVALQAHYNSDFRTLTLQVFRKAGRPLEAWVGGLDGKAWFTHTFAPTPEGVWETDIRLPQPAQGIMVVKLSDGKPFFAGKLSTSN